MSILPPFRLAALHVGHEPSSAKKLLALFQKHYVSQVSQMLAAAAAVAVFVYILVYTYVRT